MQYKIKLNNPEKQLPENVTTDGYLGIDNYPIIYTRGEGLKKARMFGGKLEPIGISKVVTKLTMLQIPENALLHDIVKLLSGRESFLDADSDNNERIYTGDIFEAIFCELVEEMDSGVSIPSKKVLGQLNELSQICDADYVQIIDCK